ncbi:MAG: hypothetical protein ABI823_07665 [Bryobacteraceae bacterium]
MTEHRVRAVNTAATSENKIHDNEVAARYGFRGGLVPGVTVYGYMTAPVLERLGPEWLERGTMEARFLQPFYEDELVISQFDGAKVTARKEDGTECGVGSAALADDAFVFDPVEEASLPESRPQAVESELERGRVLGTIRATAPDSVTPEYLLALSNEIFVKNFVLGPWIHTGSDVRNLRRVNPGEQIEVRARVADRFERKGHQLVTLDVAVLADGVPAQAVRHTAIYRLRAD